jgi:LuxR family maltose regulon positive regulatory protein
LESNLLSTKLFIPEPRQDYIIRENLLASLDISFTRKLSLIAAPPGYGKTTLLSVWIKERDFPAAWLSLDNGDNDSVLFLHYLIAALQNIDTDIGNISLALIKNAQGISPAAVLSALLNDLAHLERDAILVLDDYHSIENQEVHDHIGYLLDHLPPSMHIVLASRSDPPLSISRMRSRNQLLEIRQADLRLTPEESSLFLNQSMGLDLSDHQVSQLESRTEGWFAGLQFAGLSLGRYEDRDAFLQTFSGSHRYVIDYLADEVYSNQSEEMQAFLQKIAILDRFSAPLCEIIAENPDASRLLGQLDEDNLFLVALDDQRRWYRFQHLFRDYLLTQTDHEQQVSLQRQAANWFLENNFFSEAVRYAAASGDNDLVAAAITRAARGAFEAGEIAALTSWLKMLPDQVLMSNGQLATYMGLITFFSVSPEKSIPFVQAAEQNFPTDAPSAVQGQLMSSRRTSPCSLENLIGASILPVRPWNTWIPMTCSSAT